MHTDTWYILNNCLEGILCNETIVHSVLKDRCGWICDCYVEVRWQDNQKSREWIQETYYDNFSLNSIYQLRYSDWRVIQRDVRTESKANMWQGLLHSHWSHMWNKPWRIWMSLYVSHLSQETGVLKQEVKWVQYVSTQCFHSQEDLGPSNPPAPRFFDYNLIEDVILPFLHLHQWSKDGCRNSLIPWLNEGASAASVSALFLEGYQEMVSEKWLVHVLFRQLQGPCSYLQSFISRNTEPGCDTEM